MSYKIAFIGGGSVLWTPRLCSDMLQEPKLRGSSLHLVDVDAEALKLTQAYLEKIDEALASGWRIATS